MRLTGSRAYYRPTPPKMPPGLTDLIEGLTKEVLKHNPSDIYGFCAGHVEQLLEKRDGASRKKLSVEEKIIRAQQKVRQRAEKRKQEYDKNVLLQKQSSDAINTDINGELTLQVPQLITTSESQNVNDEFKHDNASSTQEKPFQSNAPKTPIHHEHALENSSEIEVSRESAATISTPDNLNKKDGNVDTPDSKEENDKDAVTSKTNYEQTNYETKENNDNEETPSKVVDTEIIINHDNNLGIEGSTVDVVSDSEKSIANEHSNENVKGSGFISEVDVKTDQEVSDNDTLNSNMNASGNDSNKPEDVAVAVEHDNTKNEIDESCTADNLNVKNSNDTEFNKIDNNLISDKNDSKHLELHDNDQDIPVLNVIEPDTNMKDSNENNNNEVIHPEKTPVSTNIENQLNDPKESQVDNEQPENHSSDSQDLSSVKETTETKGDVGAKPLTDAAASEVGDNSNDKQVEITEPEQLSMLHDKKEELKKESENAGEDKEEPKESINTANLQPETELSQTHVDKDVPTLVTENIINDANQDNEVKIATSHNNITDKLPVEEMSPSQVDMENTVLDKVNSDNEDVFNYAPHDVQNNSTDPIVNFSNANAHSMEVHSEGISKSETSDNMNENTQNENHDPANMDLETAAITIQKVFRTFLFKSRGSTFEDTGNDEGTFLDEDDDKHKEECDFPITSALNIDRRAHGITRMDTVLQTVNEEKSLSLSDDSSTLSSAATIIQAHVRGFLVRNKLNSYKTVSTNSLAASNSNEPSITSLEVDNEQNKNKTVLNIHIVPEGENYLSRDESLITSMELSLDSSPTSSINLHPLGYDKSERRKQLKREDAIQSISPPSNNSGKLSEDVESVKELSLNDHDIVAEHLVGDNNTTKDDFEKRNGNTSVQHSSVETALNVYEENTNNNKTKIDDLETHLQHKGKSITKLSSDEMDVVTPFISNEDSTLIHSGEFHDAVLPTRVSRSDTSVVSEFKNVLVYFLLWNHS